MTVKRVHSGAVTPTLEQWLAQERREVPAPSRGSSLVERIVIDADWPSRGSCRGKNADIWYGILGQPATYTTARAICSECPVRKECLDHALKTNECHGVWGGLSPDQRARLLGRNRAR